MILNDQYYKKKYIQQLNLTKKTSGGVITSDIRRLISKKITSMIKLMIY